MPTSSEPEPVQSAELNESRTCGEAGEERIPTLGELLLGRRAVRGDGPSLFKSVGTSAQDLATARAVLRVAEDQDLGALVPM